MENISRLVSNHSMVRNPDRMASPLIHPFGLPLLKAYKSSLEKNEDQNRRGGFEDMNQIVSKLTDGLLVTQKEDDEKSIWMQHEPRITTKIREVLQDNSADATYTGESEERVEGLNSQEVLLKGKPDIVERFFVEENNMKNKYARVLPLSLERKEQRIAVMITEVSVDQNGGEKKLAQAYEYARLQKGGPSNQVLILVWLHFDRKFKSGDEKASERFEQLSITQESWLFVGDKNDVSKARIGFLWREVFKTSIWQDVKDTILDAFMAYARSLATSRRLSELLVEARGEWKKSDLNDHCLELCQHEDQEVTTPRQTWRVVSDNVAIENDTTVYKIFDNRQHQTWRKLNVWLTSPERAPWLAPFEVKKEFLFEESTDRYKFLGYPLNMDRKIINVDEKFDNITLNETESTMHLELGPENSIEDGAAHKGVNPSGKRGSNNSRCDASETSRKKLRIEDPIPRLAYPLGSVCVISYNYFNGTHVASELSHFLSIAKQVQQMHDTGFIHGDIRNFNMVHPWPQEDIYDENYSRPIGGIEASTLIDFDFSCNEIGKCRYPPGFASKVLDNTRTRCGKQGALLEKKHDWIEFASAISKYSVDISEDFDGKYLASEYLAKRKSLEKDFRVMTKRLFMTGNVNDEKPFEILSEFCANWAGNCLLKLNEDERQEWLSITTGSNSPNKNLRDAKTTRTTVRSDGKRATAS